MPNTRSSKRHIVIPNGLSDEEVNSSESEDEISKVRRAQSQALTINKNSSTPQRAVPNPIPPTSVRFDKYDHWPVQIEKGRCRNSGCTGYTRISCSKCELRLCLNDKNNCFKNYHNE